MARLSRTDLETHARHPDSGKLTVFAGAAHGGDKAKRRVASSFRNADAVDYWDGEELLVPSSSGSASRPATPSSRRSGSRPSRQTWVGPCSGDPICWAPLIR